MALRVRLKSMQNKSSLELEWSRAVFLVSRTSQISSFFLVVYSRWNMPSSNEQRTFLITSFDVLLTMHLSIILEINQLNQRISST